MSITEIAIKRPSLIIIIFAALTVIGLFCYSNLQYELLPKMSPPFLTITTVYPGASPSEVETSVSKVIEDAVSTIDKVSAVRSTSQEGVSIVSIEMKQEAKVDVALQDAQRKVSMIAGTLPKDAKAPTISKIAIDEAPILRLSAFSNMPAKQFYQYMKDNIQPRLSSLSGVGQIALIGGEAREIKVNLDVEKLRGYGLSILQAANAVKAANLDYPTGKIKDIDGQFVVRLAGKFSTIDEMREMVIGTSKQGAEIKLKDVAEVHDAVREYQQINRINGNAAIGMLILKQNDANAVTVSQIVRDELAKIEKDNAYNGLKFDIAQDSSIFTMQAADAVKHDLMLAVILVGAVMLIFLHSLRNSIIVMVAIPASLVTTFIAMYMFGFSLNLMTLLGLSLVVGILVDDSIVVLENIYRHLEMGKKSREAALDGRNEIGFTALSITLVDVVVFFPLSVLPGIVGNIMREFSIVVLVSTLMSLFVSFTITPMMASRFTTLQHLNNKTLMGRIGMAFESWFSGLQNQYASMLRWSLKHPIIVTLLAVGSLVGAVSLVAKGFIGNEFIPVADKGEFSVVIEVPSGSSFENTNLISRDVENLLTSMPEVEKLYVNVGASAEGFLTQSANNISEIIVTLVPKEKRARSTNEMIEVVKASISDIPGVKPRVNPIGIFGTANMTPIQMVVSGTHADSVTKAVAMVENVIRTTPGATEVRLSAEDGKPETRIEVDREKLAIFGLSIAEVGATLQTALRGDDNSKFRDTDNTEYDIRIALDEFDRSKTSDLLKLPFVNKKGEQIELQQFARVYQTLGPTKLQRENRNSAVTIFSQVAGRPSGVVAAEAEQKLSTMKLPIGTQYEFIGDVKNQKEAGKSMGIAMLASVLFVYMVMVALYDSFVYPFVVLFSIPLAIIGAFLALALTMKTLNIFTQLGLIMLIGLVAKNAILLVDFANEAKAKHGLGTFDALVEAGKERLRPILMTTVAMVIGMFPIAVAGGAGGEWKTGLAWSLIGGLTSSMLLTLVFVPVVYQATDKVIAFIGRITGRKDGKPQHEPVEEMEMA